MREKERVTSSKYILALDQGTTSSRALVIDKKGEIVSMAQREFKQIFPMAGWVEHDPTEIWSSQAAVATEAMARLGIKSSEIASIGITNQRETTVVWDRKTGEPINNAIVWQDRRTAEICDKLKAAGHLEKIHAKTGLLLDAYFSATKIQWLLQNMPGARTKADRGELAFGTIDSWLIWKLTDGKVHATDITNASRTLLFDIHRGEWDAGLCKIFDIPMSMLPDVKSCSEIFGYTAPGFLAKSIPISGVAGDQHAAMFGQMCTEKGMVKNTYGTGCFLMMNTGKTPTESRNNLLTTIAWKLNGETTYALEGSIFIGGAVVQWLRDGLELIEDSKDVESLASSVDSTDGVYMVPAFAGLGAPHWDQYARGSIFGITRGTTRAHIARAALEAIVFQSQEVIIAMQADAGLELKELRVDGGASVNNFLMAFQADLANTDVVRPKTLETTAMGAAFFAGLAVGFWADLNEIKDLWQRDRTFHSSISQEKRLALLRNWNKAVERSKGWAQP